KLNNVSIHKCKMIFALEGTRPNTAPPARDSGRNGLHTPSNRRDGTDGGLGERRSAGLSRVGRRFARWPAMLVDRNARLWLRLADENRRDRRQQEDGENGGRRLS